MCFNFDSLQEISFDITQISLLLKLFLSSNDISFHYSLYVSLSVHTAEYNQQPRGGKMLQYHIRGIVLDYAGEL